MSPAALLAYRRGMAPGPSPWFARRGPIAPVSPLVCAVPHAGTMYPPALRAASRVPPAVLEQLEDRHADRLIEPALGAGAVAIVATVARAWIDLNRGEEDLDPGLRDQGGASARARSGLGLLPRRVGRHDLWRTAPTREDAEARIAQVHRPYHAAIAAALDAAHASFGYAVLIDCHSMPPLSGARPARIVIGDRHGRSAAAGLAALLASRARDRGLVAAVNAPYAGAHTLDRHGAPQHGIHALQLEFDRSLYLAADLRTVSSGLAGAQRLFADLADAAIDVARPAFACAAE